MSINISPEDYVADIDMLNICLSKGIGAPFGSVLVGKKKDIDNARRYRKWYGGALHQSGLMAAIALNKLKNYENNLKNDNNNAKYLASIAENYFELAYPVETNIVMIKTKNAHSLVNELKSYDVLSTAWTNNTVRFVTSSNVNKKMISRLDKIYRTIINKKQTL